MVDRDVLAPRVLILAWLSLIGETVGAALAGQGISVVRVLGGEVKPHKLAREWRRARPDIVVILSDLESPEAVERVCSWLGAVPGPSIVLTSTAPGAEWGAALEASAREVLPESTVLAELSSVLGVVLSGRSLMDDTTREELVRAWLAIRGKHDRLLARMGSLTPRERTVLRLLYAGDSVPSIAELFGVSEQTVRSQVHSILVKLGVHSQVAAIAMYDALRHGRSPS